jgi:aminoglycoside N3'-acetyltransferase
MKEEIINQLKSLGIKNGDTLFITADLLKVGLFIEDRDTTFRTWFDILISLVGEQGTLVVPAYTPTFFRFGKSKEFLFKHDSPSTSGSLSVAFSKVSGVLRSTHPSNSCFAYGFNSDYILRDHNEFASSYLPYHKIIELGGKHLMLGCANDAKLGLMTIHPAQEILGITKKMWQCGLFQTYYFDKNGCKKLFTRRDFGGCTSFGYKFLGDHIVHNSITFGKTGNGLSGLVDCKKSLNILLNIYKKNPKSFRCDNHNCPDCWGSPIHLHPFFWIKSILSVIVSKLRKYFTHLIIIK